MLLLLIGLSAAANCDERLIGDQGEGYRGCQDTTRTGRACMKWTQQSPHTHDISTSKYPDAGIGDHNFCRNPDGEDTIWCYTTDSTKRWDYCDPLKACPVSLMAPLQAECICENETTPCEVGKFCYSGGCKDSPQCTVRPDIEKNIFYGAKVYGSWNANNTKHMSINFTTPFDVTLNSISWKNAKTDELKFDKSNFGEWVKDTSNACEPVYILDVHQTKFFGDGSKFKIKGSQLSTNLKVDASETITTTKNGHSYTYVRSIKNTVPVLVNLETKTIIDVRFRTTHVTTRERQDFVLFVGAEDNFALTDAEKKCDHYHASALSIMH